MKISNDIGDALLDGQMGHANSSFLRLLRIRPHNVEECILQFRIALPRHISAESIEFTGRAGRSDRGRADSSAPAIEAPLFAREQNGTTGIVAELNGSPDAGQPDEILVKSRMSVQEKSIVYA